MLTPGPHLNGAVVPSRLILHKISDCKSQTINTASCKSLNPNNLAIRRKIKPDEKTAGKMDACLTKSTCTYLVLDMKRMRQIHG